MPSLVLELLFPLTLDCASDELELEEVSPADELPDEDELLVLEVLEVEDELSDDELPFSTEGAILLEDGADDDDDVVVVELVELVDEVLPEDEGVEEEPEVLPDELPDELPDDEGEVSALPVVSG